MLYESVIFDERYDDEEYKTTTLYFMASKEILKTLSIFTNDYSKVIGVEISIEFPSEHIEPAFANVCVSPTMEVEGGTEEYDWHDVYLPPEEIEELIKLADL